MLASRGAAGSAAIRSTLSLTCNATISNTTTRSILLARGHLHAHRQLHLQAGRVASLHYNSVVASPCSHIIIPGRGYATTTTTTGPPPAPTQATNQSKSDTPTISDRPPSEDARKLEDWVLYHPVYTKDELHKVKVVHYEEKTIGDRFASTLVKIFRKGFDIVTGYKHSNPADALAAAKKQGKENLTLQEMRDAGLVMTPQQWLARCLFLESVAGVPGMCAAVLRHLRSLRLMRRDGGFIHDLLGEAENERMHLLSFMKMGQPSLFFRLMVLGAQGIFTNAFFFSYLISPRTCHRFVGKLEEEAVYTYSMCIQEIEAGRLPEWEGPAPRIAIDYWRLPEDATILDMVYSIRSDEAGHRFYNHSIANLEDRDFNPFAIRKPTGAIQGESIGFTREEGLKWYQEGAKQLEQAKAHRQQEVQEEPDALAKSA